MKFIKTTLFLFALLSLTALQTYSQSTGLGIESGINMGDISSTPSFTTSSKTGLMVGGFADISVSPVISIRPGVRYVVKGFSSTFNGVPFTDKLSYIEIPMQVKVNLPLNQVKPFFTAGPTLGILLSANEEFGTGQQAQDLDASQIYETIDFGLYFGGGVDFHVANRTSIFTAFGYSLGITNISKLQTSIKNHGFQITSGIKFSL